MKNMFLSPFIAAVVFLSLFLSARAELAVSFHEFESDELVINTTLVKIRAKDLIKKGIKPIKLVMHNPDDQERSYTIADESVVSVDQVYHRLRYGYIGSAVIIGCVVTLLETVIIGSQILYMGACDEFIFQMEQLDAKYLDGLSGIDGLAYLQECGDVFDRLVEKFRGTANDRKLTRPEFVLSLFLPYLLPIGIYHGYIYRLNKALFVCLHDTAIDSSVSIAPGASITKILFLDQQD